MGFDDGARVPPRPAEAESAAPAREKPAVAPVARPAPDPTLAELRVEPLGPASVLVHFPAADAEPSPSVLLRRDGERFVAPGAQAVRGPLSPLRAACEQAGATAEQAQALEFFALWFGAPLDAVRWSTRGLLWGGFQLGGEAMRRALALWKQRTPQSFVAQLGRYGDGLETAADEEERGSEPRWAAILARAAGHPDALRAQASVALELASPPAPESQAQLELGEKSPEPASSQWDARSSRRVLVACLLLRQRLAEQSVTLLEEPVRQPPAQREASPAPRLSEDEAWLARLESRLRAARQSALADSLRWLRLERELCAPLTAAKRTRAKDGGETCR